MFSECSLQVVDFCRGTLRMAITQRVRGVVADMGANLKRKANKGAGLATEAGKRMRGDDIGGLRPDWKKQVKRKDAHVPVPVSQRKQAASSQVSLIDDDPEPSEFQGDESETALQAARASKTNLNTRKSVSDSNTSASGGTQSAPGTITAPAKKRTTSRMGIQLNPADATSRAEPLSTDKQRDAHGSTGAKYSNMDLPFNKHRASQDLAKWRSVFLPKVCDWAGTLANPWATSSHPDFGPLVMEAWCDTYVDLVAVKEDPAIVYVVRHLLLYCSLPTDNVPGRRSLADVEERYWKGWC
ncbi:hypothetical protein HGRIS_001033 [Hohenbuehelia grisea]|uniref:Uncharacterized protein n=1 Tax=Hohenbuehelia grisea TaxID=104357 RepID=A0ABR3JNN0_9AGAR